MTAPTPDAALAEGSHVLDQHEANAITSAAYRVLGTHRISPHGDLLYTELRAAVERILAARTAALTERLAEVEARNEALAAANERLHTWALAQHATPSDPPRYVPVCSTCRHPLTDHDSLDGCLQCDCEDEDHAPSDPPQGEDVFTAAEVIEIANETSDSLGNLYRLDFIDRIRHEAASSNQLNGGEHLPLAVVSYDGIPFIKCSCNIGLKPQSAVWLSEHWRGTEDDGVAAIKAVIARQAARADHGASATGAQDEAGEDRG